MTLVKYHPTRGLRLECEAGARISVGASDSDRHIVANREGLVTLARHLLTMAQDGTPHGIHLHLDQWNGLEDASAELTIELQ